MDLMCTSRISVQVTHMHTHKHTHIAVMLETVSWGKVVIHGIKYLRRWSTYFFWDCALNVTPLSVENLLHHQHLHVTFVSTG